MQNLILSLAEIKNTVSNNTCSIDNLVEKEKSHTSTLLGVFSRPILPPVKGLLFNNNQLPPLPELNSHFVKQQKSHQQHQFTKYEHNISPLHFAQRNDQRKQLHASALILAQSSLVTNPFDHLSQILSHVESSSSGDKSITGHEIADKIIRDNGDYSLQLKEIFGSLRDIHLSLLNWPMIQYSQDIPVGEIMRELVSFIELRDLEKLEFLIDKLKRQLDLVKYWKDKLGHLYVAKVGSEAWCSADDKLQNNSSKAIEYNSSVHMACSPTGLISPIPSSSIEGEVVSGLNGGSDPTTSKPVYKIHTDEKFGCIPEQVGEFHNEYFKELIVPNWFIVIRDPKTMNCLQCDSHDTSEWRSGPLGRKSMCNACGIWYMKLKQRFGEENAAVIMEYRRLTNRHDDRRVPKKFEVPLSEVERVKISIRARVVEYLNTVEIPVKTRRRALLHKERLNTDHQRIYKSTL